MFAYISLNIKHEKAVKVTNVDSIPFVDRKSTSTLIGSFIFVQEEYQVRMYLKLNYPLNVLFIAKVLKVFFLKIIYDSWVFFSYHVVVFQFFGIIWYDDHPIFKYTVILCYSHNFFSKPAVTFLPIKRHTHGEFKIGKQ